MENISYVWLHLEMRKAVLWHTLTDKEMEQTLHRKTWQNVIPFNQREAEVKPQASQSRTRDKFWLNHVINNMKILTCSSMWIKVAILIHLFIIWAVMRVHIRYSWICRWRRQRRSISSSIRSARLDSRGSNQCSSTNCSRQNRVNVSCRGSRPNSITRLLQNVLQQSCWGRVWWRGRRGRGPSRDTQMMMVMQPPWNPMVKSSSMMSSDGN